MNYLDVAVPFYEHLTGATAKRSPLSARALASIGPFLLLADPAKGDRIAHVVATLVTDDLDPQPADLKALVASVVGSPLEHTERPSCGCAASGWRRFRYVGR